MRGRRRSDRPSGQPLRARDGSFVHLSNLQCRGQKLSFLARGRHGDMARFERGIFFAAAPLVLLAVDLLVVLPRVCLHWPRASGFADHGCHGRHLHNVVLIPKTYLTIGMRCWWRLSGRGVPAGRDGFQKFAGLVLGVSTVGLVCFFFLIFRSQVDHLKYLLPECAVLSGWSFVLLAGMSAFAWRRKFYPAWSWLLPFACASFLLLTNVNYDFATNYQQLLCLGLSLPHYFLGEFVFAIALLAAAMVYRRLFRKQHH